MPETRVVSADSHVMEPADLWVDGLEKRFRDRAPRVVKQEKGPPFVFVAEGTNPFPVAAGFAAGRSGEELREFMGSGYEAARPSGWDPVERIKDQEIDGVVAEVLYPTLGMPLFGMGDGALQRACFRTYNDWVADFAKQADANRVFPLARVPNNDPKAAAKVQRCAKLGLRGGDLAFKGMSLPLWHHDWDAL